MRSILGKLFRRNTLATPAPEPIDALCREAAGAAAARDFPRAIALYDEAIALDPSHAEARYKRGNAQRSLGQLDAAIASYEQAIALDPGYAHAYCNRGVVQQALGLAAAALSSYDRAIALDPADAMAHYNRALLMQDGGRCDEALASYDEAVAIDPAFADAQYNRSLALLFLGDFANGWRAYEWRWKNAQRLAIGERRKFTQPLWLGDESVAGKRLLLHSEGGLGDTLQFCRYATLSAALGATVLLEVQPELLSVLANLDGVSGLFAKGSTLPSFDYQCPMMSLPLAFRTTLGTIPTAPKYLHGDNAKIDVWRALLGKRSRPRIGLAWSGNPNNPIDQRRSVRLADWVAHLPPEFHYFQLQKHLRAADKTALDANPFIISFDPFDDELWDFDNTAALCLCMDLVITVDTSMAHLSGALGQRTWVLLPVNPDWRWLQDRGDSPWYPTMKLYRQRTAGDWNDVFARVAADLRRQFPVA
ncbi:MAG: tetratricopeptide repeat protein [Steroidobacterales bacterium]